MRVRRFFLLLLILALAGCQDDEMIIKNLDKEFPAYCRYDVPDIKLCQLNELRKVSTIFVFSDKERIFYKAKNPNIYYTLEGSLITGKLGIRRSFPIMDNRWNYRLSDVHLPNYVSRPKKDDTRINLRIIGVDDILNYFKDNADKWQEFHFAGNKPSDSLKVFDNNCVYGRRIKNSFTVEAIAIIKHRTDGMSADDKYKRDACLLLSFYYYLGASDIYNYRKNLVIRSSFNKENILLGRYFPIVRMYTDSKIPTSIGIGKFQTKLDSIITNNAYGGKNE